MGAGGAARAAVLALEAMNASHIFVVNRNQERAGRLMAWVPLATILAYAVVILLAQLRGLDLLGEVVGMIF